MSVCKVKWCVAFAQPDGVFCLVHAQRGAEFCTSESGSPDPDGDCTWCDGTAECEKCSGEGEHQCECGDEHDCSDCNGTGKCPMCKGTGYKDKKRRMVLDRDEQEYLDWAGMVLVPHGLTIESPWDQPESA